MTFQARVQFYLYNSQTELRALHVWHSNIFNIKMLSYLSKFGDPDKKLNNVFPSSSSLTQFFGIHHHSYYPWHNRKRALTVECWGWVVFMILPMLWIVLVGVCNTAVSPCYEAIITCQCHRDNLRLIFALPTYNHDHDLTSDI